MNCITFKALITSNRYKFRKLCCHHQVLNLTSMTETRWPPLNLSNQKEKFADTCDCRTFPSVVVSHGRIEQNVDASKICMGIL